MNANYQVDKLDLQIIQHMMNDAQISYADLGKKLFVSGGTIHVRIKKLQEGGIITGTRLSTNIQKLGFGVFAFTGIIMENTTLADEVAEKLKEIPQVVRLNYITGHYNLFAEIQCRSIADLQDILHNRIETLDGVKRTETFLSLKENFKRNVQVLEPD